MAASLRSRLRVNNRRWGWRRKGEKHWGTGEDPEHHHNTTRVWCEKRRIGTSPSAPTPCATSFVSQTESTCNCSKTTMPPLPYAGQSHAVQDGTESLKMTPKPNSSTLPGLGFQAHPCTTSSTYNPFGILAPSAIPRTPNTSAPLTQLPTLLLNAHIANLRLRRRPRSGSLLPNVGTLNINGLSWAKSRTHKLITIAHLMAANDIGVLGLQEMKALDANDIPRRLQDAGALAADYHYFVEAAQLTCANNPTGGSGFLVYKVLSNTSFTTVMSTNTLIHMIQSGVTHPGITLDTSDAFICQITAKPMSPPPFPICIDISVPRHPSLRFPAWIRGLHR
jgi:hypothetical protein